MSYKRSRHIKNSYYRALMLRRLKPAGVFICAGLIVIMGLAAVVNIARHDKTGVKLEDIAAFRIPGEAITELGAVSIKYSIDFYELLSVYSYDNLFFPDDSDFAPSIDMERDYARNFKSVAARVYDDNARQYEQMFRAILGDLRTFPVAEGYDGEYVFSDSWGMARDYGSKRVHQGTDILDTKNARGRLPVVSMTDGEIENTGWLELGGFRVGIRSQSGTYYYYAHLDSFAPGLSEGSAVRAGDLLGYMGDTGYGKEGQRGKFAVHLHVGISPAVRFAEDFWINPYPFLRMLEASRISKTLAAAE